MITDEQINVLPLSGFMWKPILLKSNYKTLSIQQTPVTYVKGITFNIASFYKSITDITINNESILMLTDYMSVKDIFAEDTKPIPQLKDYLSHTTLKLHTYTPQVTSASFFVRGGVKVTETTILQQSTYNVSNLNITNDYLQFGSADVLLKTNLFNLTFIEDYVQIHTLNNKYIAATDTFIYATDAPDLSYKFEYILNDISIILYKRGSNFSQPVSFNSKDNTAVFITLDLFQLIPLHCILYIDFLKEPKTLDSTSIENSYIVKYNTDPISATNTLLAVDSTKYALYNQNYLINIPLYSDNIVRPTYINSLKNYQTANYEYSNATDSLTQREYTSLFTGNNQKNGLNNIFLNYTSNTLQKVFKPNTDTVFHYPATGDESGLPLSASKLYEEGAIAGKNPFTSDRISYSRRDYRELNIPTVSSVIADNSWQCSWLSAGPNGSSMWIDRSYTGAKFTNITQEYLLYAVNDPLVVDIPSTMMLLPNRVYSYYHQGQDSVKTYIDNFAFIHKDGSTKLLDINNWSNISLIDNSIHKNNGLISLNTADLNKDFLYLNGHNYVLFPATSSLAEDKQFTVGCWIKVNDWNNIQGSQIIGNYADGGFGLFNEQLLATSFLTIYDNLNGYIYNFNSDLNLINEQVVQIATKSSPVHIVRTVDQNYWLINTALKTAIKFDLNNNSILLPIDLSTLSTIDQIEVDSNEIIYVVDATNKKIITIDSNTGQDTPLDINLSNYNRIEIVQKANVSYQKDILFRQPEKSFEIVGVQAKMSVADNNDNIWSVLGINLYKNKSFYANIGRVIQITCDFHNNLWIIHDTNKVTKINTIKNNIEFTRVYSSPIVDTSTTLQSRFINFISVNIEGKEIDFTIIVDNQEKTGYLIDPDGSIFSKINFLSLSSTFLALRNFNRSNINFCAYGDFTGYQHQRKFYRYSNLVWKIKTTLSSNVLPTTNNEVLRLAFPTTNFSVGWHYFSLVFDHAKGYTSAYVDGVNVATITFKKPLTLKIKKSNRPITIGAITTEQSILNDTIGIGDKHKATGYFAFLHIYKYAFDQYDISCLYRGTFNDSFKNLVWNIPVGKRNYIEEIERFFMQKMPGSKSKYFNLKVKNFAANTTQKELIENAIRGAIKRFTPVDTTLNIIKWD